MHVSRRGIIPPSPLPFLPSNPHAPRFLPPPSVPSPFPSSDYQFPCFVAWCTVWSTALASRDPRIHALSILLALSLHLEGAVRHCVFLPSVGLSSLNGITHCCCCTSTKLKRPTKIDSRFNVHRCPHVQHMHKKRRKSQVQNVRTPPQRHLRSCFAIRLQRRGGRGRRALVPSRRPHGTAAIREPSCRSAARFARLILWTSSRFPKSESWSSCAQKVWVSVRGLVAVQRGQEGRDRRE